MGEITVSTKDRIVNVEDEFQKIIKEKQELEKEEVKNKTQLEESKRRQAEILENIKREFNISSIEEAKEKRDVLISQIESELAECEENLKNYASGGF